MGMECEYVSKNELISELFIYKDQLCCEHCKQDLFFPKTCNIYKDPVEEYDK